MPAVQALTVAYLARVILVGAGILIVLILFLEWMFHDLDD